MKHKIYCFNNGGPEHFLSAIAIADDGRIVGQHCCSHECWMPHDLGIGSDFHHDDYNKAFGENNWELEWVESKDIETHKGLKKAFKLNQKLSKEEQAKAEAARPGIKLTFDDGTSLEKKF